MNFTKDRNRKHAFFIYPIVWCQMHWLFIESTLFVMRCSLQCRTTNIISENVDDWHTEMRSKAQRHHCFSLSHGFPAQPRDGGPLRQWGGADETPGPVQRHAQPDPQHLTPPQAHLPRGRTWDSAGLGMWTVTAVTRICSQYSESKTCWCSVLSTSPGAFTRSPARPWKIELPLRPPSGSQNLQMLIMQIRILTLLQMESCGDWLFGCVLENILRLITSCPKQVNSISHFRSRVNLSCTRASAPLSQKPVPSTPSPNCCAGSRRRKTVCLSDTLRNTPQPPTPVRALKEVRVKLNQIMIWSFTRFLPSTDHLIWFQMDTDHTDPQRSNR